MRSTYSKHSLIGLVQPKFVHPRAQILSKKEAVIQIGLFQEKGFIIQTSSIKPTKFCTGCGTLVYTTASVNSTFSHPVILNKHDKKFRWF